jgi:FAD/FMN-containing dehydrogenase
MVGRMETVAAPTALDPAAVDALEVSFRGSLVRPGDPDYDQQRRVWNGSIDRRPAVIARCAGAADVISAVGLARRTGAEVAVRGGGHSFPGQSVCDDGLVIDLGPMRGIRVDPQGRTVRVQAGALLGDVDRETQAFGLATPTGIVTHTGVGGLTVGGGLGWLQRKLGLTIDQLIAADVVTAQGELLHASETENPDLFWAIRGGGGNFGIVTEFELRLHRIGPEVLAGPIFWAMEDSPEVLRFYRDWIADAPDELMTMVVHRYAPPLPFVPEELHGKPVVVVVSCWCGDFEEGERVIAPMRAFGTPVLDVCQRKPYLAHQAMFDPTFPHGRWYYFRSVDVPTLSDEIIDITVEHSQRIGSKLTAFPIWQLGGAVARVGEDETAYSGRAAGHAFNVGGATDGPEGFDEERRWVRDFSTALEPHGGGVYVNFLMDEGQDRVREAYGAEKYDRLRELKRRYDPENLFRRNQNIPPA